MTAAPYLRADQTRGCCNQVGVVPRRRTIGQHRDVFQPGADAMYSFERASIDGPTRYAISVVNVRLVRDAAGRWIKQSSVLLWVS